VNKKDSCYGGGGVEIREIVLYFDKERNLLIRNTKTGKVIKTKTINRNKLTRR
jgi:hypothetical protein